MVKRFSALETNYNKGQFLNDQNAIELSLEEKKNFELTQIAAWPNTIDSVGLKVANHLRLNKYPLANQVISNDKHTMMRTEPLKWWIIGTDIPLLSTQEATTLDLSHSFVHIEISGIKTTDFLKKHLSIDLRDDNFAVNSIASSAIHHVSIKLWRTNNSYHLFIHRGFGLSLWEIFLETAKQYNFNIK